MTAATRPKIDWRKSPVDIANEHISVTAVLRQFGVQVDDVMPGITVKIHCIWNYVHPDSDASLRIYGDSNEAYCFAGCGTLTPVRIYAEMRQLPLMAAARLLLEENGIARRHWTERAQEAVSRLSLAPPPSIDHMAMALVEAVRNHVSAPRSEYDPDVVRFVTRALEDPALESDPERWLAAWKQQLSSL